MWAICVLVDESKCLDTPIFGIFNNFGASSIFSWVFAETTSAACPSQPGNLEMIFMTFAAGICDADDPCSASRFLLCHLGVPLDLCIFGAFSPIRLSLNDRSPSVMQNELLRPTSLLHRSPLSYFWPWSGSTPKFSPIFPIPYPLLLLLQEFS